MKILIVYDSAYGNTARVAAAVGDALRGGGEVQVLPVAQAAPQLLADAELLFVGSPTQRFRPLPSIAALLRGMPRGSLANVWVAAFDTRIEVAAARSAALSFFVGLQGRSAYAARHIERALRRAGGKPAVSGGEGFYVEGTEGPLKEGELERAREWACRVGAKVQACAAAAEPGAAPAGQAAGPRRDVSSGTEASAGRRPGRSVPN